MTIALIVAIADNVVEGRGHPIGYQGTIPWCIPEDMKRFKALTTGHPIIMGRKTYDSIDRRTLPKRVSIILSKTETFNGPYLKTARSLDEALDIAATPSFAILGIDPEAIYITGGEQIYREALPLAHRLDITHVHKRIEIADTYFPQLNNEEWKETARENHETHSFATYERR